MEEQLVFKIDKEKKDELAALAKEQGVTLSGIIRQTLYETLKKNKGAGHAVLHSGQQ